MIQRIHKRTPDVDMSCPRAMAKVTPQECVGQKNRQTCGTETVITDACTSPCTDIQKCRITIRDSYGSMCTEDHISVCTDVM